MVKDIVAARVTIAVTNMSAVADTVKVTVTVTVTVTVMIRGLRDGGTSHFPPLFFLYRLCLR